MIWVTSHVNHGCTSIVHVCMYIHIYNMNKLEIEIILFRLYRHQNHLLRGGTVFRYNTSRVQNISVMVELGMYITMYICTYK